MGGGLLPLTVVLLGTTGSGKSSLGNSLLNKDAFVVAHTAASGTAAGKLESGINPLLPDTSLSIIDTPGYGDSEGKDQEHLQSTARLLEGEGFVNCFLLVLNGTQVRFDGQIFDMLQAYVRAFGTFFLYNTVVVVTHWEMSVKASRARERKNITQETFAQSWLQELQNKIDLTELDHVIPFVYIDNEMFNNPDGDEEEKWIFEEAQRKIFEYVDNKPLFPCLVVDANVSIKSNLKSKAQRMGLSECTRCGRFFETSKQCLSGETFAGAGASTSAQGVIAAARAARVIEATSKSWSPDIAIKAMSRGWHASTGVHLFGKLASRVGPLVPVGVGVYRVWQAENNTERVQAVVGTSAGIAGGYGGAAVGVSVGSFILPGIGTVIGGVVGGLIGSFGSQVVAEKVVQTISDEIIGDLCIICKQ